ASREAHTRRHRSATSAHLRQTQRASRAGARRGCARPAPAARIRACHPATLPTTRASPSRDLLGYDRLGTREQRRKHVGSWHTTLGQRGFATATPAEFLGERLDDHIGARTTLARSVARGCNHCILAAIHRADQNQDHIGSALASCLGEFLKRFRISTRYFARNESQAVDGHSAIQQLLNRSTRPASAATHQLGHALLQRTSFVHHGLYASQHRRRRRLHSLGDIAKQSLAIARCLVGPSTGDRFDAANSCRYSRFADYAEQSDPGGISNVSPAAQLSRQRGNVDHTYDVAVLLTEQRHRAR